MKIQQLIKQLKELEAKHGNAEIWIPGAEEVMIQDFKAYWIKARPESSFYEDQKNHIELK